jgi:hypothetical protein
LPRLLSTLLVVVLMGGTAAAFGVTQGLKNEKSPIVAPRIAKVFSPVCDCATRAAEIQFRLRKPDRVRVEIVRGDEVVRVLVEGRRLRRGKVHYTWNGRDDQGQFVPEGVYRPRVHLDERHRTIVLPNDMRVDTTAPRVRDVTPMRTAVTPGRRLVLHYRLSDRGHGVLNVRGRRAVFTRNQKTSGSVVWVAPRTGDYLLALSAQDAAGNSSAPVVVRVHARYVELARDRVRVKAGLRFGVRVDADTAVRWRLDGRSGRAKPGLLVLRAPQQGGRYRLVVSVGRHSDRAIVVVRPR